MAAQGGTETLLECSKFVSKKNTRMYSQYPNPYQPAPSPTAFDEQKNLKLKQLQVDSILKRFPNARIVSFDKSTIDIPVIFKGNNQVTFRMFDIFCYFFFTNCNPSFEVICLQHFPNSHLL